MNPEEIERITEDFEKQVIRLEVAIEDVTRLMGRVTDQEKITTAMTAEVNRAIKTMPTVIAETVKQAAGGTRAELDANRDALRRSVAEVLQNGLKALNGAAEVAGSAALDMQKAQARLGWKQTALHLCAYPLFALWLLCLAFQVWPWEMSNLGERQKLIHMGETWQQLWPKLPNKLQEEIKKIAQKP